MAFYAVNKDGQRFKIAGGGTGGGISEIPVATENILGGLKSSSNSGSLSVNPDNGEATINDNVTMDGSGTIILNGVGNENGPHTIEITPDPVSASVISYDNTISELNSSTVQGAIDELASKNSEESQLLEQTRDELNLLNTEVGDLNNELTEVQSDVSTISTSVINVQNSLLYYSNINILDNWFFTRPINQKNQTSYEAPTGSTLYFIDRWILCNHCTAQIITGDGINITYPAVAEDGNYIIQQRIEYSGPFRGNSLTLSFLVGNVSGNYYLYAQFMNDFSGTEYSQKIVTGINKFTFTVPTNNEILWVGITSDTSKVAGSIKIYAAKLERGTEQTLVHLSDGKFIYNDPYPNYQQELAKCQRYFQIFGNTASVSGEYTDIGSGCSYILSATSPLKTEISLQINLAVPLRKRPVITINRQFRFLEPTSSGGIVQYFPDVGSYIVQFIEGFSNIANIGIRVPSEQLPASSYLQVDNSGNIENWLSLDSNL